MAVLQSHYVHNCINDVDEGETRQRNNLNKCNVVSKFGDMGPFIKLILYIQKDLVRHNHAHEIDWFSWKLKNSSMLW
jgi:hypothetical protein